MKQSAEMRSALEFFATAQSCRELSVSVDSVVAGSVARAGAACCAEKLEGKPRRTRTMSTYCRESSLRKWRKCASALGTVLTVLGDEETKNSSCVELESALGAIW